MKLLDEGSKRNIKFAVIYAVCLAAFAAIDLLIVDRYSKSGYSIVETIFYVVDWRYLALTLLLADLSGQVEAYYMHYKYLLPNPGKHNPHPLFTVIRLLSSIPIYLEVGWQIYLCYMAVFVFVHDGALYAKRNDLNPNVYHKRWFSTPDKSEDMAWSDKVFRYPIMRVVLFLIGLITFILIHIHHAA